MNPTWLDILSFFFIPPPPISLLFFGEEGNVDYGRKEIEEFDKNDGVDLNWFSESIRFINMN